MKGLMLKVTFTNSDDLPSTYMCKQDDLHSWLLEPFLAPLP